MQNPPDRNTKILLPSSLRGELVVIREMEREYSGGCDSKEVASRDSFQRQTWWQRGACCPVSTLSHTLSSSPPIHLWGAPGEAACPAGARLPSFRGSWVGGLGWSWRYPPTPCLHWCLLYASHRHGLGFSFFQPNALLPPSPCPPEEMWEGTSVSFWWDALTDTRYHV